MSSPWRREGVPPAALEVFYGEDPPSFGLPFDAPGGVDRWASSTYAFRSVSLVKDIQGVNGYDSLIQQDFAETAGGLTYDGYPLRSDLWEAGWTDDVLRVSTLVIPTSTSPTEPTARRVARA